VAAYESPPPSDLLFAQNVQPKAGTPGVAQDSTPAAPAGNAGPAQSPFASMMPILMMVAIVLPFLFLSSRQKKKDQQARSSLKKGDRVTTQAGLIGELIEMDERVAKVKIAPGVNVQMVASTVSPFAEAAKPADAPKPAANDAKPVSDKK
jgi:preprotein translocase subunit YajC